MKKKIVSLCLIASMVLGGSYAALATPLSDAQTEKTNAESNLNYVNGQIESIQTQQADLQAEIDQVDTELYTVILNLEIVKDDIVNKTAELEQAQSDLADAKDKEAEQYESMKERIRFMYENGDSTFLEALMGAEDFADVLNKVENFSQVYDYDRNLLVEYQNTKLEVATLVETVETEKSELQEIEEEYETQQSDLETLKDEKAAEMDDFDTQLAAAEALALEYKATITEQNAIIAAQIAAQQAAAAAAVTAGSSSVQAGGGTTATGGGTTAGGGYTTGGTTATGGGTTAGGGYTTGGTTTTTGGGTTTTTTTPAVTPTPAPTPAPSGSGVGGAAAAYACQFVGNPYVWGGTSLTNGADCSGFVMSVYANYGISLPHSSDAMAACGSPVTADQLQPGDLIVYSGHVAIYIGGGAIVHASNSAPYPAGGIKISPNYNYRTIIAMRRL